MFIEWGELRAELLILLIYNIGIFFAKILINYDKEKNPLYYLFIKSISHFFVIIPLIPILNYKRKTTQTTSKEVENNNNQYLSNIFENNRINAVTEVQEEINKNKKVLHYYQILLISFLYFATYAFFYYYYNYKADTSFYGTFTIVSEIFYFSLFDVFILKTNISKHHYFGMFLITVSISILYIIISIKQSKKLTFLEILYYRISRI